MTEWTGGEEKGRRGKGGESKAATMLGEGCRQHQYSVSRRAACTII